LPTLSRRAEYFFFLGFAFVLSKQKVELFTYLTYQCLVSFHTHI